MSSNFALHDLGYQWRFGDYIVFFGNNQSNLENLNRYFPHFEPMNIKQTHSDLIVEASCNIVEADAQFSDQALCSLNIRTADCMPIFIIEPFLKMVVAVHAGWRGVANHITPKATKLVLEKGGLPSRMRVVIGPHIRKQSFEVDEPVWAQLLDSVPVSFNHELKRFYEVTENEKYKIDLEGIIHRQLWDLQIPEQNIECLEIDTLTNSEWHSFRRDRENSGRNISFVCRIK